MKVLVIVCLFALVAVQICHATPVAEEASKTEDKPEATGDKKDEAVELTPEVPTDDPSPTATVETKSESISSDPAVNAETPVPEEEAAI